MKDKTPTTYTAFRNNALLAAGPLDTVIRALKTAFDQGFDPMVLVFEDQTGAQIDFDLRGSLSDVLDLARPVREPGKPGRPKLGVVSREISLLPRHWEWLESQPSGASAAVRRLMDEARKRDPDKQRALAARAAAARFMSAIAGNMPQYEDAARALYAADQPRFEQLIREWPADVQNYLRDMATEWFPARIPAES